MRNQNRAPNDPVPFDMQPMLALFETRPDMLKQFLTSILSDPTLLPVEFKSWLPSYFKALETS